MGFVVACGGGAPTASPTPVPTATNTPAPTATPTKAPLEITRELLPASASNTSAGRSVIPGVELYKVGTGFRDNADAADDTLDPEDTAEELASTGFKIGYEAAFQLPGSAVFINSTVHLFETPQDADAYIERQLADFERFAGQEIEDGVMLAEFVPAIAPDVGTGARGGKLVVEFSEGRAQSTGLF